MRRGSRAYGVGPGCLGSVQQHGQLSLG